MVVKLAMERQAASQNNFMINGVKMLEYIFFSRYVIILPNVRLLINISPPYQFLKFDDK
jgi:hypothetical protein